MRIGISGYGRMGHEIETTAREMGHEIVLATDQPEDWYKESFSLSGVDIMIEFSTSASVIQNIRHCFDASVPVVVGTTGWHEHLDEIREECRRRDQSLFYAPNFNIGVNLFFELNRCLARLMAPWSEYEISIEETHHVQKADAPSGTAIVLATDIIANQTRKEKWVREQPELPEHLGIRSYRVEDVTGTHTVFYESEIDRIEITHTAKSRRGFARGAMMAAEWLIGRKGFFEMTDLLESIKNKTEK